ncbi:hypothetical protein [Pseudomonas sp. TMP25]|uniref:hypothetical protein n=1 Tax=Pseudomonas sp. TMP25 TaxID=3136561 RepID=UPI003100D288
MSRRAPRTLNELLIGIIGAIIFSLILYFGVTATIKHMGQQLQEHSVKLQQDIKDRNKQPLALPPKQAASDPFEAQVAKAAAESKQRHDSAWEAYYQQPKGCDNWQSDAQMVNCVNDKMRAKKEFEEKWAAGAFDSVQEG